MNNIPTAHHFEPNPPDAAGVISWVHVGDLHMRAAGDQNHLDLQAIVAEVNQTFANSISFVFLPGDNADHGDAPAYEIVRQALDRLRVPWCAIVGDHDVERKSFDNFKTFLAPETHYAFRIGNVRYLALNAFDVPEPPSFTVLTEQLAWIKEQLRSATSEEQATVLLLHCYPSDLKHGREELTRLVAKYTVKLIDMGHTHYNEISHDGRTIYTATRSTGQIEEGPVGFSVTNLDRGVVSWRFLELGKLPAVIITSPADERLIADDTEVEGPGAEGLTVRAKIWSDVEIASVVAAIGEESVPMDRISDSNVWAARLDAGAPSNGVRLLQVAAVDKEGRTATDEIKVLIGSDRTMRERAERDQDNALEAWPEHGLLGTQLGPNKNGRKW